MVWRTVGVVVVAVAMAAGCSREAGERPAPPSSGGDVVANAGWRTVTAEDMTAEQRELQQKSQKAVQSMAKQLMGELTRTLDEEGLGGLVPIRLKAECGMCHGPEAEISAEIRTAIHEGYPKDAATGFHEGDLRGWFWVEAAPTS